MFGLVKNLIRRPIFDDQTIGKKEDAVGGFSNKAHLMADQKEAMVQGGAGAAVDAAIHYQDWGFRLDESPNPDSG